MIKDFLEKNGYKDVPIIPIAANFAGNIDLLIETQGKIFPVEVKMGQVSAGDLVPLAKIREKNWMKGQVVSPVASLVSPHPDWKSALPNEIFGQEFWS